MKIRSFWPYLTFILITVVFFNQFIFKGLVPIPADILPGVYYPWHDISFPGLPAGVPVKNALPSDIISLTYPLRLLSINLIKSGEWPLWNPYILSGTPLLANFQSAVFNPLNLLYMLPIKFYLVWSFQVLLQPLLASIFLYLFLRSLKLSKTASVYGSFVWGFGGFVALWAGYNTVIHAILTLPLALWAVANIYSSRWSGLALSFSVFYSIAAGNPPMSLILLATSAFYAVWEYRYSWKKYLFALFFVLAGLGLSAVLILPGLELMKPSIRDIDTVAFIADIKNLPIFKLITFIAPDFFGNPSTLNLWSQAGLYDNLTVYLGVIPFMLFVSSFFHFYLGSKHRLIRFFWFLFFFSLVLAVRNPLSIYIGNLSLLGLSSMVMTRFTVITGLSVAVGSALVVDELLLGRSKFVNWRASLLLSAGFIVLLLLLSLGITLITRRELAGLVFGGQETLAELINFSNIAFRNSAIPIIIISLSFVALSPLLLWANQPFKKSNTTRLLVVFFLSLITFFDLFRFYQKYNTFSKSEYLYPSTPITDYLQSQEGRFARENAEVIPSNTWLPYGLYSASGYDTLHSLRYNQFLSFLSGSPLSSTSSRYAEVGSFDTQYFDFLGIQNIVAMKRKLGVPDSSGVVQHYFPLNLFPLSFEHGKVAILKNPRAFPLVFSVTDYKISGSIEETEKLFKSSDLHQTAILEKTPQVQSIFPAKISDIKLSRQGISFNSESTSSALYVTSQSFNTGWNLLIDGEKREVQIVNHAFVGFFAPEGKHKIELYYWPNSVKNGVMVSGVSLIFLLSGLLYLYRCPNNLR